MINFFRPLHFSVKNEPSKTKFPSAIGEVYHNSAGFFHDFKKTWQVMIPIPLRHFTSVLFDLITLKTRPQELLMSDSEHFRECLRCNIGDFTFQEAFDRTGRILNITVTPNNSRSVLSCRFTCHDNVNVFFVAFLLVLMFLTCFLWCFCCILSPINLLVILRAY